MTQSSHTDLAATIGKLSKYSEYSRRSFEPGFLQDLQRDAKNACKQLWRDARNGLKSDTLLRTLWGNHRTADDGAEWAPLAKSTWYDLADESNQSQNLSLWRLKVLADVHPLQAWHMLEAMAAWVGGTLVPRCCGDAGAVGRDQLLDLLEQAAETVRRVRASMTGESDGGNAISAVEARWIRQSTTDLRRLVATLDAAMADITEDKQ